MNENKKTLISIGVIIALIFLFLGIWDKFSSPADLEFTHFGTVVDIAEIDKDVVFLASIDNMESMGLILLIPKPGARIFEPKGKLRPHELIGRQVSIIGEEHELSTGEPAMLVSVIFAR